MTRDEIVTQAKTLIEESCARHEIDLIVRMALDGVPPQQILDAYVSAREWNAQAVVDGLKQIESLLDRVLTDA